MIVSSFLTKYTDTATAQVIDAVVDGRIIPLYNEDVLAEYKDVLCRPRFSFESGKTEAFIRMIRSLGIYVNPSPSGEVLPDADDLVFYEIVMERRDDGAYLVTGNMRHYPAKPCIVTPAQMMRIIEGKSHGNAAENTLEQPNPK